MKSHELKTWPGPFQAVWEGKKTYELRKDDRGIEVGDVLLLREWKPSEKSPFTGDYTQRSVLVQVSYVTRGGEWRLPKELCILGFHRLELREPASRVRLANLVMGE